jgi:hypothetical protein
MVCDGASQRTKSGRRVGLEKLHRRKEILGMAEGLYGAAVGSHTEQSPKAQPG